MSRQQLQMLGELNDALDNELFADVTFCCQSQKLQAHRILLSASSPYLQKLLLNHPVDDHVTIILDAVDHEDLAAILLFIYTGKVSVNKSRFNSFLSLAELLDIEILNPVKGKTARLDAKEREMRCLNGFAEEEEYKYKLLKLELEAERYLKSCANLPKVYFMKSIERAREFVEEKMSKFEQEAKMKFEINERKQLVEGRLQDDAEVDDINVAEILNNLPGMSISKVHVESKQNRRSSSTSSAVGSDRPRGLARVKPLPSLMPIQRSQETSRIHKQTSRDESSDVGVVPAEKVPLASPSWSTTGSSKAAGLKHWRPVAMPAEDDDAEKSPLFGLLDLTMKDNERFFKNSAKAGCKRSLPETVISEGAKDLSIRSQLVSRTTVDKDDDVQIIETAATKSPESYCAIFPRDFSRGNERVPSHDDATNRNNDIYERILRYREEIRVNGRMNSLDVREKTRHGLEIFKSSEDVGRKSTLDTRFDQPDRPWDAVHRETAKRPCLDSPEELPTIKAVPEIRHLFLEKSHQHLQQQQSSSTAKASSHASKPTESASTTTILKTSLQPFDKINILNKILEETIRAKNQPARSPKINFTIVPQPIGNLQLAKPNPDRVLQKVSFPAPGEPLVNVNESAVDVVDDASPKIDVDTPSLLTQALLGDVIVKVHGCDDCGKHFARRQLLVQHQRIHSGVKPYRCEECGKDFTQRGHWSTHQKQHEPRSAGHVCTHCSKAFITRASLKVHLRTHSGVKPYQCPDCSKEFSQLRNFKYHLSIHAGTNEFACTCPECGKYFNDRGYLSSHMKIHLNRKEYQCQFCEKSFNQRVAYNMHVRIHTGLKPHTCTFCPKSFSRKMLLKQHLRIHTGERPFSCGICNKAFADRSNMSLHMRLHSGIKPYNCAVCDKSFTKKHHLKTHMNFHMGVKPYNCDLCALTFSQSSNMRTHRKRCLGQKEVPK